jgi:hypothetical protein
VSWQEDVGTLRRAYLQEPAADLRMPPQALWLLRSGQSVRATAEVIGVHEATVSQWLAWYRHGGLDEVWRHRRGSRALPRAATTAASDVGEEVASP